MENNQLDRRSGEDRQKQKSSKTHRFTPAFEGEERPDVCGDAA
jgi:hypothetical protein